MELPSPTTVEGAYQYYMAMILVLGLIIVLTIAAFTFHVLGL